MANFDNTLDRELTIISLKAELEAAKAELAIYRSMKADLAQVFYEDPDILEGYPDLCNAWETLVAGDFPKEDLSPSDPIAQLETVNNVPEEIF